MSKGKKQQAESSPDDELKGFVRPGLDLAELRRLKSVFDVFDNDKSGSVSVKEINEIVLGLGLQEDTSRLRILVASFTKEHGVQEISFQLFLRMFGFVGDQNSESSLESLFREYDREGKGFIDMEDIKRVCAFLSETYNELQTCNALRFADRDKDGRVGFEQFCEVVTRDYPNI